jgi:hypothetical protein
VSKTFSDYLPFLKLKRMIWEKNKDLYAVLSQNLELLVFEGGLSEGISAATSNLEDDLSVIYKTNEFKKIFREVKKYAVTIERQWNRDYEKSLLYLTDITKIDLSKIDKKINVYISHPKIWRGRSYPENNVIAWSHPDEWKNYTTIYLWHEIMHHITASKSIAPHLMHAIIELSCDNELRIKMNHGGKYFKENNIPVGHKYLVGLDKKILPDWNKYLNDPSENIFQFEKRMLKKYRGEKLLKPQSGIAAWAEWH